MGIPAGPQTPVRRGRPPRIDWFLCALMSGIALWCLRELPSPRGIINDPDFCFVLLEGKAIFTRHRWLFVDYYALYGPATYAFAGLLLKIGAGSLLAVTAFGAAARGASLLLVFWLAESITRNRVVSLAVLLCAMLIEVKQCFFFMSLFPLGFLALVQARLSSKPSIPDGVFNGALGLLCGLCFLFRHDFGVYLLIGSLLFFAVEPILKKSLFAIAFAGALAPWIALLLAKGSFLNCFEQIAYSCAEDPYFNALVHPLTFTRGFALGLTYLFFYGLAAAGAGLLFLGRRRRDRSWRFQLIATAELCLCLCYSAWHSGYAHLAGSVWPAFALMAQLYASAEGRGGKIAFGLVVCGALAAGATVRAHLASVYHPSPRPGIFGALREAALPLSEFAARNAEAKDRRLIEVVRRCTRPEDLILALPGSPELPLFAERGLAGRHYMIENGYYRAERYQKATIAELARVPPKLIVFDPVPTVQADLVHPWANEEPYLPLKTYIAGNFAKFTRGGLDFYTPKRFSAGMKDCVDEFARQEPLARGEDLF